MAQYSAHYCHFRDLTFAEQFFAFAGDEWSEEKAGDRFVALDSPFNHCEQGKIVIPRMRFEPSIDNEEQHIAEMAAFFREQVESKNISVCWYCLPADGRCSGFSTM